MRTGGLFRRNTTNVTSKREEDFADYAAVIGTEVCNKKKKKKKKKKFYS
jgi:hypothetical protein